MKPVRLLIYFFCLVYHYVSAQSVTVLGAGNAGNNAYSLDRTYFFDGEANGKNQYRVFYISYPTQNCPDCGYSCSASPVINWTGTQWQLTASGNTGEFCTIPTVTHSSTAISSTNNPPCGG